MSVLKGSLQLLLDTDVALKSSRTDNRIIMEQLLAKLLMVSGKGGVDLIVVKEAIIVEGSMIK